MYVKTVAIIGAGVSGLASIKACLEENLVPKCFEYFDTIGGTWNLTDHHVEGQGASVYESMRLNTSKNMTCFSDFPFPPEVEHYPDLHTMRRYLDSYAKHFSLLQYINFNCDVISVRPTSDHVQTGRWLLTYRREGTESVEEFDAVMVCSGRQRVAKYPLTRGMTDFCGKVMHVIEYRKPDIFKDKVVIVIGNGSSAGDVAVEASKVAKQVYFSSGDGFWIVTRKGDGRSPPVDYGLTRLSLALPNRLLNYLFSRKLDRFYDHRAHDVVPPRNRGPVFSLLCVNDELISKLKSREVIIKHDIRRIMRNAVEFKDGSHVDVDTIVCATGYGLVCKFLTSDILSMNAREHSLYRLIIPTSLQHPTLALIGCISLRGAVCPTYEMQARWAVALFTNRIKLPDIEVMLQEVDERKKKMFYLYGRHKMWETGVTYTDELSRDLQNWPSFWSMLLIHPWVLVQYYWSTAFPMFQRLYGRNAWPDAWNAIQSAQKWKSTSNF